MSDAIDSFWSELDLFRSTIPGTGVKDPEYFEIACVELSQELTAGIPFEIPDDPFDENTKRQESLRSIKTFRDRIKELQVSAPRDHSRETTNH